MTGILSLWLPILLSAVLVFFASSIIHMASPWHKGDYPKLPNEDAVRDALRSLAIPPGNYMMPRASGGEEMKSAAFQEKINAGPNMMLTIMPNGPWTIGPQLAQYFLVRSDTRHPCHPVPAPARWYSGRAVRGQAEWDQPSCVDKLVVCSTSDQSQSCDHREMADSEAPSPRRAWEGVSIFESRSSPSEGSRSTGSRLGAPLFPGPCSRT